jgi:adenylate kinase family enzyme
MNRILLLGSPGAGKSYFSKKLAQKIKIPLYHLDNIFWNKDKTHITHSEFENKIAEIMKNKNWIIDGNYSNTYKQRIEKCDTIFFFDLPLDECLKGINNRIGKPRSDMPWVEDSFDPEFKKYVLDWHKDSREELIKLLSKQKNKNIIVFNNRDEYNKFLDNLNIISDLRNELLSSNEAKNPNFVAKLIPTINPDTILGIKSKVLKQIAKKYLNRVDLSNFLNDLPHKYLEEYLIHGIIISSFKDYDLVISEINKLLPYIDNWASCDTITPKIFLKNYDRLENDSYEWIRSEHIYTRRFGIRMFMCFFLNDHFKLEQALEITRIVSDEYYLNMMVAWYVSFGLVKQYDSFVKIIESRTMPKWVHNKSIQKALESFRIDEYKKEYLKSLKIR